MLPYPFPQTLHMKGFSPVWTRRCFSRLHTCVKLLSHIVQTYGLSPVCERMWIRKLLALKQPLITQPFHTTTFVYLNILFAAKLATKQLVSSVVLHVLRQTWRPLEGATANRAEMRLAFDVAQLPRMLLLVLAQVWALGKRHGTLVALVRFLL